ncbi:MAG: HlyD family secretion protein [Proteobacteria bacterium]|nr:HlyD family secretion protein [Pseudomonadota bacterium]
MAVLLLLTYAAICVVAFKLLRFPVNQWTVTTASIGGLVVVGGLLLGMNYNHPFTNDGRLFFYTTPIVPTVRGHVISVAVQPNVPLKQGDLLFRIDPRPYQYAVDQKKALLAEAEQNVRQLKASLDQASAGVEKAQAQLALSQETYDRQADLLEKQVVSQAAVDKATRNLEAARQTVVESQAAAERARLAFSSEIGGVNTTVASLQADLANAEFNLSETNVVAPTDGYVTQLTLKPGMTASPLTPTMVFIHSDENTLTASFSQNALQRVRANDEAEIAFDAIPGRVFRGKVQVVIDAISQGQLEPTGTLFNPQDRSSQRGRAVVRFEVLDDLSDFQLPAGSSALVAVYSDHLAGLAIMRRILLRMKSWMNYVV